jgi:motility quorum-sensing regulator/GCU-specific mRNA interferase toxin
MEKRRPSYDLISFIDRFDAPDRLEMTMAALKGATEIGLDDSETVAVIQSMQPSDFYKSMTSYADHTVWQDVYHVPWGDVVIYLKFTEDRVTDFRILSFKEK